MLLKCSGIVPLGPYNFIELLFVFRSSLSVGSMIDGVPEVPLAEAPTIVTSAGNFRLSYTDLNKLSYRRIARPEYSGKILK